MAPRGSNPALAETLEYKAKAIRLLNESLTIESQAVTTATVYAILCTLTTHWVMHELEEIAIHVDSLQKHITLRGGFHGFPIPFTENLLGTMYVSSAMTGSLLLAARIPTLQTMPEPS